MKKAGIVVLGIVLGMVSYVAASSGDLVTGSVATGTVSTGILATGSAYTGSVTTGVIETGAVETGSIMTGDMDAQKVEKLVAYIKKQTETYGETKRLKYILLLKSALKSGAYPEIEDTIEDIIAQVHTPEEGFYLVADSEGAMGYGYKTDGSDVYLHKQKLEANLESFQILQYGYSRDEHTVFYQGMVVPGADASAFKVHQYRCATDQNHMYYHDKVVEEADVESLEVLDNHYAKDEDSVFFHKEEIEGADPKTFSVIKYNPYYNAKDAKRFYKYGKPL